ncbi:hypothetical protein DVDV_2750 [Desulfovibrio sp. DV]|nr:hypothetical protein DVDV_2750 [Desulfovibrio sp. DV]
MKKDQKKKKCSSCKKWFEVEKERPWKDKCCDCSLLHYIKLKKEW